MPRVMRHLCDSNIWLALTLSGHSHHPSAAAWFRSLSAGDTTEFCRATQTSYLRLLTTPAILGANALSNDAALACFQQLAADSMVVLALSPAGWNPFGINTLPALSLRQSVGWTLTSLRSLQRRVSGSSLSIVVFEITQGSICCF